MGRQPGPRGTDSSGEPDSRHTLWRALRRLVGASDPDQSLRAAIAEAIDEHEEEGAPAPQGDLSPLERQMLKNLLRFSQSEADDVAIPRSEIVALPATASWSEVIAAFAEHGHSRLPVYRDSLDEIIGMMLIKDVFPFLAEARAAPADWHALMREPLFVPGPRAALDVLADMRARRVHLAVVVDEYAGTEGIITFEDLVEEIVGAVEDEHDDAAPELLRPRGDGAWDADARAELDEVAARIDPRLAEDADQIDTIGGLAVVLAERVPRVGTRLTHPSGWGIEVTGASERRVTRLRLHPPAPADA